jgi:hypothetical protein
MKPYLIMNEVTPVAVGERRAMLPLHNTLIHWFWLDAEIPINDTVQLLEDAYTRSIRLIPNGTEVFTAPTNDGNMPVHVTTLERTHELVDLHERVCSSLVSLDAVHEKPEYTHEGFRPHITHQQDEIVNPAGYISKNLYIVTADRPEYGNMRQILAKIALKK